MKYDTYYTLRRKSGWVTLSGVLMGIPFLIQAVYYLIFRPVAQVHMVELSIFMIAPMFIELFWCLLLHIFPQKTTTTLGVAACLIFLMLLVYSLFYQQIGRTILATIAYLAVSQLIMLILCGRFPYKLFGSAALIALLVIRVLLFSLPLYIQTGRWEPFLTRELPGSCMLGAMLCVLAAIEPHKKEIEE